MQSPLSATTPGWHAQLKLGFRKTVNRTILSERFRQCPLSVQRALYPEADLCHIYLLHPPGGVVGGDRLDIQVDVTPQANALITTPGAAKFYRSLGPI
ncbi:MAG: urease accessory protein UreD, partial [Candidatus Thiodiazotropha taylori]